MRKTFMAIANGFMFCSLLISCNNDYFNDPPQMVRQLPSKEIHYNFETGEKIGQKIFGYDQAGRVIREYFTSDVSTHFEETLYEYDNDGNLVKKMSKDPMTEGKYYADEYTYEGGLKKMESMSFDGVPVGYRTIYFYSGHHIDSAQTWFYSSYEEKYHYLITMLYEYDNMDRVVKILETNMQGARVYRYENNNLLETCNVVTQLNGEVEQHGCVVNEYNANGELIRISDVSPWWNKLKEEFFYKDGLLSEKKIYFYPGYEPGNTIDITLVVYEY